MQGIPLVDLRDFKQADKKDGFVQSIGNAFQEIGFVGVKGHGIDPALIETFFQESKMFFGLPTETKKKYEIKALAGQRGYTSFGVEHAKQSDVPDLKEFFQLGQEKQKGTSHYVANVEVAEAPNFTSSGIKLYQAFEETGDALLQAIALYLNLPQDYFTPFIEKGNSILRSIYYPPITQEPKSAVRAESHEDINLITLLVGASAGGLQLLDKQENWVDILPQDDEIVINVGDMLERLTNNYLKSTTHRVVNPPRESWDKPRLSIPFFLHPIAEMDLTCLDNCISEDNPLAYEPITAGAFLNQRLAEIGLKK